MTLRHMCMGWMKSQAHSTDSIHPMNMCLSVMEMELREVEDDVVVIDENGLAMFIQPAPDIIPVFVRIGKDTRFRIECRIECCETIYHFPEGANISAIASK